ncbi:sugar phosphate isomerase/epimerase [Burkholderia sp. OAS925]
MTAFNVRIGINPLSWMNDDLPSLGGETPLEVALTEGRQIGYQGFELGNKFPREPQALKTLLAQYDLALVSGWYSGRLARGSVEEEIAAVGPASRLACAKWRDRHGVWRSGRFDSGRAEAAVSEAAFFRRRAMGRVCRARR